jgi:hypothetical protein
MARRRGSGRMMTVTGDTPVSVALTDLRHRDMAARRLARHQILARTAASRSALDRQIAAADMTSVANLPVITGRVVRVVKIKPGQPPPPNAPAGFPALADADFMRRMAKRRN